MAIQNYIHVKSPKRKIPVYNILRKLSKHFDGSIVKISIFEPFTSFKGQFQNYRFKLKYLFPTDYQKGSFSLIGSMKDTFSAIKGEPDNLLLEIKLKSETKCNFSVWGNLPSEPDYNKVIKTGDPVLDSLIVVSDSKREAERFLGDGNNLLSIRKIIDLGWNFGVTIKNNSILVLSSNLNTDLEPEFIRNSLVILIELSNKLRYRI